MSQRPKDISSGPGKLEECCIPELMLSRILPLFYTEWLTRMLVVTDRHSMVHAREGWKVINSIGVGCCKS